MPIIYKPQKKATSRVGHSYDAERSKIYSSTRWKKLRMWKIINNPLCEDCLDQGITTEAEDIHHQISFMSTNDPNERLFLAYSYDNLRSLCKQCHQKIHN